MIPAHLEHVFKALEMKQRKAEKPSPDVANCDCCDERPGTHNTRFAGMDTWICDECSDITPRRRLPRDRSDDEAAAYEAGVRAHGEI